MSSDEELHDIDETGLGAGFTTGPDDGNSSKRRKVLRACDVCRRKKIRCDAHNKADLKCTHCTTFKLACTFVEGTKKRGPPKGYIEDLQKRSQRLEDLVKRIAPQIDVEKEVGPSFTLESWLNDQDNQSRRGAGARTLVKNATSSTPSQDARGASLAISTKEELTTPITPLGQRLSPIVPPLQASGDADDLVGSEDEASFPNGDGTITRFLTRKMKKVSLGEFHTRFHGKSSGVMLLQAARTLKQEVTGAGGSVSGEPLPNRRKKFWRQNPWECMGSNGFPEWMGTVRFPPQDLADSLVAIFFRQLAPLYPVLHQPTFEADLKEEKYKTDMPFANLYLLVCAVASRWSKDPRVCNDPQDNEEVEWHSAGWKYFSQAISLKRSFLAPPGLPDLQKAALSATFLQGTSAPHAAWIVCGMGIRFAMDVGAHRRKVYGGDRVLDNELWKRSFWTLLSIDRLSSASLGRPTAIQDDDVDADVPLEVDDEYYDAEKNEWKQPPGKPSRMQYFTAYVKLMQILGFTLRTIYSINKSRMSLGFVGGEWERHVVSELDSALNGWIDALPDSLRWDPNIKDDVTFEQSAILYQTYYYIQMLVHRPFIPTSPRKPSPLSFPSLAICTNAARSASHILDAQRKKQSHVMSTYIVVAFTSGVVLQLSLWGVRKTGGTLDLESHTADIHRCMKFLFYADTRWYIAGRLYDILSELASVGDVPLPQPSPPDYKKREREPEDNKTSPGISSHESNSYSTPRPSSSASTVVGGPTTHSRPAPPPDFPPRYPAQSINGVPASMTSYSQQPPLQSVPPSSLVGELNPSLLSGYVPEGMQWNPAYPMQTSEQPPQPLPLTDEGPVATFDLNLWNSYALGRTGGIPGMNRYDTMLPGLELPTPQNFTNLLSPNSYMQEMFNGFSGVPAASAPNDLTNSSLGHQSHTLVPPNQYQQSHASTNQWGQPSGISWAPAADDDWRRYSMPGGMPGPPPR